MAYLSVSELGVEFIHTPYHQIALPDGTIEILTGTKLIWNSNPVEFERLPVLDLVDKKVFYTKLLAKIDKIIAGELNINDYKKEIEEKLK